MEFLTKIENIHANNTRNLKIIAIIIAKSEFKIFESRFNASEYNGVLRITLRDSEKATINLTIWNSEANLKKINAEMDIGTIVEVSDPRVTPIRAQDGLYAPEVTSSYSLTVTSNGANTQGTITVLPNGDYRLSQLLKLPTKPLSALLSLNDANSCGLRSMQDCDQNIDLLVVVRVVRPAREIFLVKTQTTKQYREVVVMDRSFAGMSIKLWGDQYIRRSDGWCQGTVLFLANVRVSFCKYSKISFLNVTSRTVVIEEPIGRDAEQLQQLAMSVPVGEIDFTDSITSAIPDVSTINTVMSAQQIFDRINNAGDNAPPTALCHAPVTKFDLDGCTKVYRKICVYCRSYIKIFADYCEKLECIDKATARVSNHLVEFIFDIEMDISDHTGTLTCRLLGKQAESLMGCTVEHFLKLSDAEKAAFKWQYLLERCAVKLVVKRKSAEYYKNIITVVDCVVADPCEVAERIQIY